MTATPLTPTTRYIQPGVTHYYWVASIADKASPTRSELDAGVDLSGEVAAVSGFSVASNPVDAPDFASRFTSTVSGMITADSSSLNLYQDLDSSDARTLLTRDLTGFICLFPEGDIEGRTFDVWPVSISSVAKVQSATDPAQLMVSFTITSEPAVDVAVPATA